MMICSKGLEFLIVFLYTEKRYKNKHLVFAFNYIHDNIVSFIQMLEHGIFESDINIVVSTYLRPNK